MKKELDAENEKEKMVEEMFYCLGNHLENVLMVKDTGLYWYLLKIIVSIKTYLVTSNAELVIE